MNERIRELYQQAHMVREYPQDDPWRGGNPPIVYWGGERSAEKFAELIVRECSELIRNDGYRSGPFGNQDLSPSEIAIVIEEHFGVEP